MTDDSSRSDSNQSLSELFRKVSVVQASQYFNCDESELTLSPEPDQLGHVLKRYIVMVMLTGAKLRAVLKVHFNPEQIVAFRQSQNGQAGKLTDKQIIDYMKELGNQIGGRACRTFDSYNMSMGMSIPLCTRGIYEIYVDYQTKSGAINKFGDCWKIDGPFGTLYCSSYTELTTKDSFTHVVYNEENAEEEGELDFL